jgi:hypothetical protein
MVLCNPDFKSVMYNTYSIKNSLPFKKLENKKILIIRPDRLGDMCVTFPLVFYLSKISNNVDRLINKKFNTLAKKLLKTFDIEDKVSILNYDFYNREDYF